MAELDGTTAARSRPLPVPRPPLRPKPKRRLWGDVFCERQIYERRASGARVVKWSRGAQLRLALAGLVVLVLLFVLSGLVGFGWVLYGQRFQPLADAQDPSAMAVLDAPGPSGVSEALGRARAELERMQASLAESRRQQAELGASLEKERAELARDRQKLTAERDTAERHVKQLAEQLEAAQRRNQGLSEELADLKSRASAATSAQLADTQRGSVPRTELIESEQRNARLTAELQAARDRAAALEAQIKSGLPPVPAGKAGEPQQLALEAALLQRERDAARGQLAALMESSARLQEELRAARQARDATLAAQANGGAPGDPGAGDAAAAASLEIARLQDLAVGLEAKLLEREQELAELRASEAEARRQAEAVTADGGQRLVDQAQLQGELQRARAEVTSLQERLQALEASGGMMQSTVAALEGERNRLRDELTTALAQTARGSGKVATGGEIERIRQLFESRAADLVREAETLKRENAQLVNERARLQQTAAAAEDELQKLRQSRAAAAAAPAAGQGADAGSGEELARLRQELARLESENSRLQEALAASPRPGGEAVSAPADATMTSGPEPAAGGPGPTGDNGELQQAMTRIKELDQELRDTRARSERLQDYLERFVPGPPQRAPR